MAIKKAQKGETKNKGDIMTTDTRSIIAAELALDDDLLALGDEALSRLAREAGMAGDEALRNTCALIVGDEIYLDKIMDGRWEWADQSSDWRIGVMPICEGWAVVSAGAGAPVEIESFEESEAEAIAVAKALAKEVMES